ncbi:hypothetical protein H4Q26_009836 [Puccinia striiformis f. sp. tritici PST-130]|uniref:Uncharacterized protein n=1 Tax=Puccinia striiformis f. sp. tritici PST-78 TaxID=1165861 RepID=A0A0L0V3B4_9BASI|nr:hypothetical protein H4Q26_009836 [Puccinia striiformis f. sp. tritici PST-130]KNE93661.1 hypothetical protein PSTG_12944 [Puccinia striiformis f. sp. tritici PST-78]
MAYEKKIEMLTAHNRYRSGRRIVQGALGHVALRLFVYNKDSTLPTTKDGAETAYETCVTSIWNPKKLKLPRAKIEDAFNQIGARCKGLAGHANIPGFDAVNLYVKHHPRRKMEFVQGTDIIPPLCFDENYVKKVVKADCIQAYKAMPTDPRGLFVSMNKHIPTDSISSAFKSCTVSLNASDGSMVTALKADIDSLFNRLMDQCAIEGKGGMISAKGPPWANTNFLLQSLFVSPAGSAYLIPPIPS